MTELFAVSICLLAFNHTSALTPDMAAAIIVTGFACLVCRMIFKEL